MTLTVLVYDYYSHAQYVQLLASRVTAVTAVVMHDWMKIKSLCCNVSYSSSEVAAPFDTHAKCV